MRQAKKELFKKIAKRYPNAANRNEIFFWPQELAKQTCARQRLQVGDPQSTYQLSLLRYCSTANNKQPQVISTTHVTQFYTTLHRPAPDFLGQSDAPGYTLTPVYKGILYFHTKHIQKTDSSRTIGSL